MSAAIALAAVSGAVAWIMPKKYEAAVLLLPVSSSSGGGQLGALTSQFGGLASLVGFAVPGDTQKTESLAVLQSQALTQQYIQDGNLMPELFRKQWNANTGAWIAEDPSLVPTLWKAGEYFEKKVRSISVDAKTGLVTLKIVWSSPVLAAKWANDLVAVTNSYLQQRAIKEFEANIAYLNEQLQKTDVVGVREGIYSMLLAETNKAMLARGSSEYALKVLDPALVPERPSTKSWRFWSLAGGVIGLLVAGFAVQLNAALATSRSERG